MDLPISTKALYFLMGMEADDEGFVSPKKVLRIHGGSDDDIKVLISKGFIIPFESGVVVITDWNKNNWLDSRRIRDTEYKKEKDLLLLTEDKTYVLSTRLASAKPEERRIEENRGEYNYFSEEKLDKTTKKEISTFVSKDYARGNTDYDIVPVNDEGEEISPRKKVDRTRELAIEQMFINECVNRGLPKPARVPVYYLNRVRAGMFSIEQSELPTFFEWWFANGFKDSLLNVHSAFSTASLNKFRGRNVVQSKKVDDKYKNIKMNKYEVS